MKCRLKASFMQGHRTNHPRDVQKQNGRQNTIQTWLQADRCRGVLQLTILPATIVELLQTVR